MKGGPQYTLYCAPNTYALSAHAILEEIGVDYLVHWVTLFAENPDKQFIAISPHARVPALATPDGAMFETGAIALYLAERHPGLHLQIQPTHPSRARFLQWFYYLGTTLQPEVIYQYHPEFYFLDTSTQVRFKNASMKRLARVLEVLEGALQSGPFFFGTQITILDYLLAMQAIWPPIFPRSISDYPCIERMTNLIITRPAVARVLSLHEEMWTRTHGRAGGMNITN